MMIGSIGVQIVHFVRSYNKKRIIESVIKPFYTRDVRSYVVPHACPHHGYEEECLIHELPILIFYIFALESFKILNLYHLGIF